MSESNRDRVIAKPPETIEDFLKKYQSQYSEKDLETIAQAYEFSDKAHAGQVRRSGEPYINHPLSVAGILSELNLDVTTVITGLLHDTVEDTEVTVEDIQSKFGKEVAYLVDGVTKISQMKFRNTHEKQGENIRKMIVAMGKDVRVVLVKLADRLHNMRTLNHMPYQKQARIAQETLDIYAPLASRLGINSIKVELEDLSFRYAYPDMYYELAQKVAKKKREREKYIEDVIRSLDKEVADTTRIKKFEIVGRPKHLYSIYKKMQMRSIDYEQVYDVLAFRVLVNSVPECYEILGLVHSLWKPIPGRFKDFIAMPKVNNYQSLHTTVIGPQAERIEVQIRTHEMNIIAEKGIAAHWSYKEESRGGGAAGNDAISKYNWLRDLVSLHQQSVDSDEFLENIKSDLFESEIYVFTPKGDVKEFPEGASPIDFAYSVHTDVGDRIVAARVNGKLVSLKYKLKNGDNIEVITSKNQSPSKDWLNYCVTSKAKAKIRTFVKNEQRQRAQNLGKELLEKTFRKEGMNSQKYLQGADYDKFLVDNGAANTEELYVRVGYGKITPKTVFKTLVPSVGNKNEDTKADEDSNFLQKAIRVAIGKKKKTQSLIRVDGMEDVLVRYAKCCHPIPGDPILGFITLGRGIVIHRADCPKSYEFDQDRKIDVEWNKSKDEAVERQVKIRVLCNDNSGLLKDMTEVFHHVGVNILNAQIKTTRDDKAICIFDVNVKDTNHLSQVIEALQKLKGVIGVTRMTSSSG